MKIAVLVLSLLLFVWTLRLLQPQERHQPQPVVAKESPPEFSVPAPKPQKVLAAETCNSPNSPDILVDKFHGLPQSYIPGDLVAVGNFQLRVEAANALNKMLGKMGEGNLFVSLNSAYRSYEDQQKLFHPGDLISAQPGYSEHQLGTAVDFDLKYPSEVWTWLDKNAGKYGFVMSYRYGQTISSGYAFEPWHWRYVGVKLATQIRNSPKLPQSFYKPLTCTN